MSGPRSERFTFTRAAHEALEAVVVPGDLVVDATAGWGRDTLQLARLVGEDGTVIAVDLQERAIRATEDACRDAGLLERVETHARNHAELESILGARRPKAILFNLGFLPGTGRDVVTHASTTLPAIASGLRTLAPGGRLVMVAYTGHAGGREECAEVLRAMRSVPGFVRTRICSPHREGRRRSPRLIHLERLA